MDWGTPEAGQRALRQRYRSWSKLQLVEEGNWWRRLEAIAEGSCENDQVAERLLYSKICHIKSQACLILATSKFDRVLLDY